MKMINIKRHFSKLSWLYFYIFTLSSLSLLSVPVNAQACPNYDSSVVSNIRRHNVEIGNIVINNNYGPNPQEGAIRVRLYHPDAPPRIFSTWDFAGGETSALAQNNSKINIGGDWGVQVVFGNGVTSCIIPVEIIGIFENGRWKVNSTDIQKVSNHLVTALLSNLKRIPSKFHPIGSEDYITFRYDPNSLEIGIRVGAAIFRNEIEKIPEQKLPNYTVHDRHTVKWFKYKGIDVPGRQLIIGFRYRYQKLANRPIIGGLITIYDNAANVDAGINLEVKNRKIESDIIVRHIEADWASGVVGVLQSGYDVMFGSILYLLKGKFVRLSDLGAMISPLILNASLDDKHNVDQYFSDINELNKKGFIYLKRIDYDPKGIWYLFTIDPSVLDQSISRLETLINGWINR